MQGKGGLRKVDCIRAAQTQVSYTPKPRRVARSLLTNHNHMLRADVLARSYDPTNIENRNNYLAV